MLACADSLKNLTTVILRLMRFFLWQPKNRVMRNSRYPSLYYVQNICMNIIPKKNVLGEIFPLYLCIKPRNANFFGQPQKTAYSESVL